MRPKREVATNNGQTYFVTSNTAERRPFFKHERWAALFIDSLFSYRPEYFLLHDFVLMPDHFHLLITPAKSLERAVQMVKGGFSYRAKNQFHWRGDIWVAGFSDHRIRNDEDLIIHERYIAGNPVKAGLCESILSYPYSARRCAGVTDAFPQRLKPLFTLTPNGGAEAPPFQNVPSTR